MHLAQAYCIQQNSNVEADLYINYCMHTLQKQCQTFYFQSSFEFCSLSELHALFSLLGSLYAPALASCSSPGYLHVHVQCTYTCILYIATSCKQCTCKQFRHSANGIYCLQKTSVSTKLQASPTRFYTGVFKILNPMHRSQGFSVQLANNNTAVKGELDLLQQHFVHHR